jgi:hypothetical protein
VSESQSPQEFFRLILLTVVGQAYSAAGYVLEQNPIQWGGGQFRFMKTGENGIYTFINYQHLAYAAPNPSRFRVSLVRTDKPNPNSISAHAAFMRKTLSELVVKDFGVAILPAADYWWSYRGVDELGRALAEAGHLAAGYGIPWLAGELHPPIKHSTAEAAAAP